MGMDIRTPIGGLFTILGLMLMVYGFMTQGHEMYVKSLGININIWWGLIMTVFGAAMLYFSMRAGRKTEKTGTPEHKENDRVGIRH